MVEDSSEANASGVTLSSISFDYDPTSASSDALTIRRNLANVVTIPEWVPTHTAAKDSPCAYAITKVRAQAPSIQVMISVPAITPKGAKIRAKDGGILGPIDEVSATFVTDRFAKLTIPLKKHTISSGGVKVADVTWKWECMVDGSPWEAMATTKHRVYVIADSPNLPWVQDGTRTNTQLPWTDMLDHACEWAKSSNTVADILEKITKKVNSGIKLTYDMAAGASAYIGSSGGTYTFLCGAFIDFLNTSKGNGNKVNCSDCATIVTSFANILGANVFASKMYHTDADPSFKCNQILAIGQTVWQFPFPPYDGFSYHEVAWTGKHSYADPLYDACLQYDSGLDPYGKGPHTAKHAVNVIFSTYNPTPPSFPLKPPFTSVGYRERLAANTVLGILRCSPRGPEPNSNNGRRPVA